MRTTELTPNIPDKPTHQERTPGAAIVGEMAERMIEAGDVLGREKAGLLIVRIGQIWIDDPRAMWLVLSLLTGNLSEITRSYTQQGKTGDRRSKQAVQQELEVLLASIQKRFPELAKAIADLRCVKAEWKVADEF
jgi:hypothetical protein